MAAAIRLFRDKGYHGTSMQDIADAVGLQKGSLYYYIASKEELLVKIFDDAVTALVSHLEEVVRQPVSARTKLERAVLTHVETVARRLGELTIFTRETHALSVAQRDSVRQSRRRYTGLLERILSEGIASGEFKPVDVRLTSLAVFGLCNSIYQWYAPDGRLAPKDIAERFADLILGGICPDGGAAT
ncbi:MAG: TetR/AcrR family transcriptional regulator [Firmicutes bacterium]|nr:TetR/AcrR family transcriptional regulator [Bacillota bacterium]